MSAPTVSAPLTSTAPRSKLKFTPPRPAEPQSVESGAADRRRAVNLRIEQRAATRQQLDQPRPQADPSPAKRTRLACSKLEDADAKTEHNDLGTEAESEDEDRTRTRTETCTLRWRVIMTTTKF